MKKFLFIAVAITVLGGCTKVKVETPNRVTGETYPAYYDSLERIALKDSMAAFFSVNEKGLVSYGLDDLAKAEGHICPIVTGGYLISREALKELKKDYEAKPSEFVTAFSSADKYFYRGGFLVSILNPPGKGNAANAMAKSIGFILGADGSEGFKGPGHPFTNRNNLLQNDPSLKFSPSDGIEVIITSLKAEFIDEQKGTSLSLAECKKTKNCIEKTSCDRSVKVTYKFKTKELLAGGIAKDKSWPEKIKFILDNYEKGIKVERVENPQDFCSISRD